MGLLDGLLLSYQQRPSARATWFLRLSDDPRAPTPVIQRQVLRESMKPCTGLLPRCLDSVGRPIDYFVHLWTNPFPFLGLSFLLRNTRKLD